MLRAGSPFVAMWRKIVSISYLAFRGQPAGLDAAGVVIGEIPHTPLDQAVKEAAGYRHRRGPWRLAA
ncbi:hypothetical protein LB553_03690 [Mesorhizobium sp. CA8]|nr:hypothetical protein [Mesorhizobium sp. CA8]